MRRYRDVIAVCVTWRRHELPGLFARVPRASPVIALAVAAVGITGCFLFPAEFTGTWTGQESSQVAIRLVIDNQSFEVKLTSSDVLVYEGLVDSFSDATVTTADVSFNADPLVGSTLDAFLAEYETDTFSYEVDSAGNLVITGLWALSSPISLSPG